MNSNNKVRFPGVKDGETFTIAGMEFIKFPEKNGVVPVVMRDVAFRDYFGKNNNLKESNVLERMKTEILPKIIEAVGEENVLTFKTDLTALDGLNPYGELESQISLYTLDFYRANVQIFDRYKVNDWCWMATPFSTSPHDDAEDWVLCVAPSGYVHYYSCNVDISGVRPILNFVSTIFGSCEE